MKILHLGIVSSLVILCMFMTQTSNASQPLLDSYNNSDLVIVGKIISLSQVPTTTISLSEHPNQTRYDIEVEQYYKNPQQFHLVTVYGYAKGIYLSQDPTYDVGDRVFLYLHNENGFYQIQSDSLKLDNNCDARGMIPMATLPFEPPAISSAAIGHSFYASDSKGDAPEFFLRGNNVTINFDEQNTLPVVKDATVELIVKTNNDTKIVMDDKKSVTVQACNGQIPMKWIFIPTIGGGYTVQVNVTAGYDFGNRYILSSEPVVNTGFTVLENNGGPVIEKAPIASPLKQFKSGIPADKVKCNDGFLLTFKTEDGSPACVKPETAKKLYEQGWALVLTVNIKNNNANQTLVIGADTYDVREFQPISGNAVYFDDMRFVYQGRSPLNNSCYPEIVNQTQARDFEIVSNDADFNSHSCWPPSNYPQNITKQNVLPSDLFSRYSISFFNNQTMGIGLCHVGSCEFGKMIYLAKRGWDTPIVYDSVSNLEFHLFTNASTISTGQSIGINMSTINKAQNTIIVPNKYDFSFNGTGLGPCYYGPFELEILRGYFDENNFTHGTELHMYQPGIYSCPAPEGAKGYKFEPLSDTSTPRCSPFNYCNNAEQMRDRVSFSGYWNDTDFHKFENSMYTIIAGDEWGNHSIRYFTVTR